MLQTDTRVGLTEAEVIARRKKYGLNQMKEEKESKSICIPLLGTGWPFDNGHDG
jgi:magnesium-transporting ATPase (P-type)